MRVLSQTQNNVLGPLRVGVGGVQDCAVGNASGKVSLVPSPKSQSLANLRSQAISADQQIGFLTPLGQTLCYSDQKTPSIIRKVEDSGTQR